MITTGDLNFQNHACLSFSQIPTIMNVTLKNQTFNLDAALFVSLNEAERSFIF